MAAAARAAERPRRLGSDANDLDTAGLLEHPLSADAAASPPDRLLGSEPSEADEEEEPRAGGRADAGQAPMRAAGPDAGPDADASPMGERGLEASSLLDVLLGGAEEEEEEEEEADEEEVEAEDPWRTFAQRGGCTQRGGSRRSWASVASRTPCSSTCCCVLASVEDMLSPSPAPSPSRSPPPPPLSLLGEAGCMADDDRRHATVLVVTRVERDSINAARISALYKAVERAHPDMPAFGQPSGQESAAGWGYVGWYPQPAG